MEEGIAAAAIALSLVNIVHCIGLLVTVILQASYKTNKFFVKAEEFWVPSKDDEILHDQLSQKKFREIVKDQLM